MEDLWRPSWRLPRYPGRRRNHLQSDQPMPQQQISLLYPLHRHPSAVVRARSPDDNRLLIGHRAYSLVR